jgi:hypothetical protein
MAADGAVTAPDSTQRLDPWDFTVTFSATPTRVVLSPYGGKTAAKYRIVVRHPKSIDQVEGVSFRFERKGGARANHFLMGGSVVSEPSARRTVLTGRTTFHGYTPKKWGQYSKRANPGRYTLARAEVFVTANGEWESIPVDPPVGTLRVSYATKTVLKDPVIRKGQVLLEGRTLRYRGIAYAGSTGSQMSGLADTKLKVLFSRRGVTERRVVATTKTDDSGRFRIERVVHHPGRWWVQFPGDLRMDASQSTRYSVDPS